jgi:hypothetical protein
MGTNLSFVVHVQGDRPMEQGTTSHGERRGTTNGAGGLTIMGFIAYDGGLRDGAIKYMISIGY